MNWFRALTGFDEQSREVRSAFNIEGLTLHSLVNNRSFTVGTFETPSLCDLRERTGQTVNPQTPTGRESTFDVIVGDITALHKDPANAHSLFQAASQFNALEMTGPNVTPDDGITRYEHDHTQGPACAIACGAGTLFRNYLVPIGGQVGQTATRQINCLHDIIEKLGVNFEVRNGYAMPTEVQLRALTIAIGSDVQRREELLGLHRIALQWGTEVTISDSKHLVTQAYCAALPLAYTKHGRETALWEPFARLVLDALYEATLRVGVLNFARTDNPHVYLTMVGGGVFGNPQSWITDAIARALRIVQHEALKVHLVQYQPGHDPATEALAAEFR